MTSQAARSSIRVAVLTPRLPPSAAMGGIATAHFNLFSALQKAGWQVKAFAFQDTQDSGTVTAIKWACGTALRVLDPSRQSYQLADTLGGAIAGLRLRGDLQRFQPGIIVVPDKGCPLAFMAKPAGARVVWISHHNPMRFLQWDATLSALDARLATWVDTLALKKTDLVLCPSRDMRTQFHRTYLFPGPVEIVPHLLSADIETPGTATPPLREILNVSAAAPMFYLPAAGTAVKGGRYLAALLEEIGRRHAEAGVFVSGQVENAFTAALAEAPAHVRVFSPGALPYADNLARVRECDVALSPALLESFGMALLEAAALGVPVAAFAAGGIPDFIGTDELGTNGETVPVGEIARLCDAGGEMLRKLRSGEITRAQVASCTRARISTAQTVARLGVLFQQLCDKAV